MSASKGMVPQVVHGADGDTNQTPGFDRRAAIDGASTGAARIFMGRAMAPPRSNSHIHHHGESETAAYVVKGRVRVYYGEGFQEYVEAGPGDYLFVPARLHHIEANPGDEPLDVILSRGPDNTVVNIAEAPDHVSQAMAAASR